MEGLLTALCLDAETVFEALVWVGAGDDLWVGAAHVHIPLALDDVAAIALQPLNCKRNTKKINEASGYKLNWAFYILGCIWSVEKKKKLLA